MPAVNRLLFFSLWITVFETSLILQLKQSYLGDVLTSCGAPICQTAPWWLTEQKSCFGKNNERLQQTFSVLWRKNDDVCKRCWRTNEGLCLRNGSPSGRMIFMIYQIRKTTEEKSLDITVAFLEEQKRILSIALCPSWTWEDVWFTAGLTVTAGLKGLRWVLVLTNITMF